MIGYRLWDIGLDEDKLPKLRALTASYEWNSNVVGKPLEKIVHEMDQDRYINPHTNEWESFVYEFNESTDEHESNVIDEIGYSAYLNLSSALLESKNWFGYPLIVGVVNGYGKIAVHEEGFRSEYQQILAFLPVMPCTSHEGHNGHLYFYKDYAIASCEKPQNKDGLLVQYGHDKFFKDLATKYDVDLISAEAMVKFSESV